MYEKELTTNLEYKLAIKSHHKLVLICGIFFGLITIPFFMNLFLYIEFNWVVSILFVGLIYGGLMTNLIQPLLFSNANAKESKYKFMFKITIHSLFHWTYYGVLASIAYFVFTNVL